MNNNTAAPPKVLPPGAGGPLPPSVTPGWNDPPELSTSSPSQGPKRLLNKRVPFPMGSTTSPTPVQKPPVINMPPNDAILVEVVNNFTVAIHQLPDNADLIKELERFSSNWQQVADNQEVKQLVLTASQAVKNGDVEGCVNVHKQLSILHGSGWFALFLHSFITAFNLQRKTML